MPDVDSIELTEEPTGPALHELADLVVVSGDLTGFLRRLVAAAVHRIEGADSAFVTVERDGSEVACAGTEEVDAAFSRPDPRSVITLPLHDLDRATGVLTLYARCSTKFGPAQLGEASRFADEASRALVLALRLARDDEVTDQLRAALVSRSAIDRALGIIMGQNSCDADEAFAILRAASQNRNVKLRIVASEIISAMSGGSRTAAHRAQTPRAP